MDLNQEEIQNLKSTFGLDVYQVEPLVVQMMDGFRRYVNVQTRQVYKLNISSGSLWSLESEENTNSFLLVADAHNAQLEKLTLLHSSDDSDAEYFLNSCSNDSTSENSDSDDSECDMYIDFTV